MIPDEVVMRAVILIASCLLFSGCTYLGSARDVDPNALEATEGWVAVRDVPVVLQADELDCGAAALAMIMTYWGLPTGRDEIVEALDASGRPIQAAQLRDYARHRGLKAYLLAEGRFRDLERELSNGRPVLVGLVKPHVGQSLAHYEVVVGVHRERQLVATIDPAHGWRQNTYHGFLAEWMASPSDRLTLVFSN
ncbi:MAG: cysteine peptidase family C39 domain-containing protein [Planctomycetota bacterium]|jgi:ABC-type bacteriocin/lantibiotic exporter with double-glycine peptidase domain